MGCLLSQLVFATDQDLQDDLSQKLRLELEYQYSCTSNHSISISSPLCIPTNSEYIYCAISKTTCKFPGLYEELNENIYIRNGRFMILISLALLILRKAKVI